jgi:hypothetical protein
LFFVSFYKYMYKTYFPTKKHIWPSHPLRFFFGPFPIFTQPYPPRFVPQYSAQHTGGFMRRQSVLFVFALSLFLAMACNRRNPRSR